ncbi:MAG: hypothetical protein JWM93_3100 [Frankiales bacterium]|nr:hypothetical protein [Frankiales bacterium]
MATLRIAPAVLAVTLLAACSSSSKSPAAAGTSTGTITQPTASMSLDIPTDLPSLDIPTVLPSLDIPTEISTGKGCENVTASDVSAAVGFTVTTPTAQAMGPIVLCTFTGPAGSAVLIRKESGLGVAAYDAGKVALEAAGQKTASLSGLGDAAYSSTVGTSGKTLAATVVARKGDNDVLVTVAGSTASVEQATAVAKLSLSAFGF